MDERRFKRCATSAFSPNSATLCCSSSRTRSNGKLCAARQLFTTARALRSASGELEGEIRASPAALTRLREYRGSGHDACPFRAPNPADAASGSAASLDWLDMIVVFGVPGTACEYRMLHGADVLIAKLSRQRSGAYDKSLVARSPQGDGIVGATLVVARVGLPTARVRGAGRHKGVPYDGFGLAWHQWPLTKGCRTPRSQRCRQAFVPSRTLQVVVGEPSG